MYRGRWRALDDAERTGFYGRCTGLQRVLWRCWMGRRTLGRTVYLSDTSSVTRGVAERSMTT